MCSCACILVTQKQTIDVASSLPQTWSVMLKCFEIPWESLKKMDLSEITKANQRYI